MKFGKSFELALEEEHFPEEWVSASIKYKQLKVHYFSNHLSMHTANGFCIEMH